MENYRRYDTLTEERYNRKGISYYFLRKKPDEIIIPYLKRICNERVLEVGIGYGYYRDIYYQRNSVTGYDINPGLGEKLGIEIIKGKADEIGKIDRRFDRVLSFYMTEYLNPRELYRFINDSVDLVLEPGGVFGTTIIVRRGLGKAYTFLAAMKGIKKYSYSYYEIRQMVQGRKYKLAPLHSYLGIPMAAFLEIKK